MAPKKTTKKKGPTRRRKTNRQVKNTTEKPPIHRSWGQSLLQGIIPAFVTSVVTVLGLGVISYYGIIQQIEAVQSAHTEEVRNANDLTLMRLIFDILLEQDSSMYEFLNPLLRKVTSDTLRMDLIKEICTNPNLPQDIQDSIFRTALTDENADIYIYVPRGTYKRYEGDTFAAAMAGYLEDFFNENRYPLIDISSYPIGFETRFELLILVPYNYGWDFFVERIGTELIDEYNIPEDFFWINYWLSGSEREEWGLSYGILFFIPSFRLEDYPE